MIIKVNGDVPGIGEVVALRSGPPTLDELRVYYPARFTWPELKTFVNSGDLGLLKRDLKLQRRYDEWAVGVRKEYGSMINYLLNYRLQWGKPDTLSLLTSAVDSDHVTESLILENGHPEPYPMPEYFRGDIPFNSELLCIIQNDWPYSVPTDIEHTLIWSKLPIFHPALVPSTIDARIQQDGICGYTGSTDPLENLPSLESCLPGLSEWGITMDKLVRSPRGSDEEEMLVRNAGKEVSTFVKRRWRESQWETAWFVNPTRLQSIPGLAHIHVFARRKTVEEEVVWDS